MQTCIIEEGNRCVLCQLWGYVYKNYKTHVLAKIVPFRYSLFQFLHIFFFSDFHYIRCREQYKRTMKYFFRPRNEKFHFLIEIFFLLASLRILLSVGCEKTFRWCFLMKKYTTLNKNRLECEHCIRSRFIVCISKALYRQIDRLSFRAYF